MVDGGSLPRNNRWWIRFRQHFRERIFFLKKSITDIVLEEVIQFSHYSVKEFLTSVRLAGASDIILRRYHVSITSAHTLAAQACLGIVLHIDEDVGTTDSLEKWPFVRYASRYWIDHARFKHVSQVVNDGMKQLFDPRQSHFTICFRINQGPSFLQQTREEERPLVPPGTPLHYAALLGLRFHSRFPHRRAFTRF
jgi:hypothetical protein